MTTPDLPKYVTRRLRPEEAPPLAGVEDVGGRRRYLVLVKRGPVYRPAALIRDDTVTLGGTKIEQWSGFAADRIWTRGTKDELLSVLLPHAAEVLAGEDELAALHEKYEGSWQPVTRTEPPLWVDVVVFLEGQIWVMRRVRQETGRRKKVFVAPGWSSIASNDDLPEPELWMAVLGPYARRKRSDSRPPTSRAHAAWRMVYHGSTWDQVAAVLGYPSARAARDAARRFAHQDGRPWPPEDQR